MLTVIMCTHNGADTIGRTLEAFCGILPPAGGWKLVIVDNASSDSTPTIIQQFAPKLPLTVVQEPRLGLATSQNTGISHVEGDLAVFTDDDVLPDPDWLREWRRVAGRFPGIEIFGGTITPEYEVPPPDTIATSSWIRMLYACTDPTLREGPVSADEATIYGPNMAVRASALARGCRFDDRLMSGPAGLLGNETDFVMQVAKGGAPLGFAPTARVQHIVNKKQVTWRWILSRFYRHGRTMYYFKQTSQPEFPPAIFGMPRYIVRRLAESVVIMVFVLMTFNRRRFVTLLRSAAYDLGALYQARNMTGNRQ